MPPRTTTKPLISVTAQSSTESTQDAYQYQEGRHPRGGLWTTDSLGRPIYSSTDSLDSTKAVTMAMESAAGKRHVSLGSHTFVQTCDKAVLVSKAEEYLKTPRASIGIQVATLFFSHVVYSVTKLPQYASPRTTENITLPFHKLQKRSYLCKVLSQSLVDLLNVPGCIFACSRMFEGNPGEDLLFCLCSTSLTGCFTCSRLFTLSD